MCDAVYEEGCEVWLLWVAAVGTHPSVRAPPGMTNEAAELLDSANATALAWAIAEMEGVKEITTCTLANLGLGTTSGIAICDCTTGQEKADARKEVVTALLALDKGLPRRLSTAPKLADRRAEAAVQVNQMVAATVRLATSAPPPKKEGPAYILTQSEEERNYSVQTMDTTEMKELCKTLAGMQNIRLLGHELGTVSKLKKVMYWTKIEGTTPDPDRVPLKVFRRSDDDSWCLAFKRAIYSVAVCAAGVEARPELRDDGAGSVKKFGVQWCNAMVTAHAAQLPTPPRWPASRRRARRPAPSRRRPPPAPRHAPQGAPRAPEPAAQHAAPDGGHRVERYRARARCPPRGGCHGSGALSGAPAGGATAAAAPRQR